MTRTAAPAPHRPDTATKKGLFADVVIGAPADAAVSVRHVSPRQRHEVDFRTQTCAHRSSSWLGLSRAIGWTQPKHITRKDAHVLVGNFAGSLGSKSPFC